MSVQVHSGFMRSWTSNGLNERVLAHVIEITKRADVPLSEFEMFVTGMSLESQTPGSGYAARLTAHMQDQTLAASS